MRRLTIAAVLTAWPVMAHAHPHIYIDASVEVVLDPGDRAVALRVSWTYDDLYSLYIIGDMGLDPDWDGALTEVELARLSGFDMKWDPDFAGDTYVLLGEAELPLGRPEDWSASYASGKITSTHSRRLDTPVAINADPLLVQIYDPGFYTAYVIDPAAKISGGSGACRAEVWGPDLDAADETLKAALAEYGADQDVEAEYPAIGKAYAEEVRVTCGAP